MKKTMNELTTLANRISALGECKTKVASAVLNALQLSIVEQARIEKSARYMGALKALYPDKVEVINEGSRSRDTFEKMKSQLDMTDDVTRAAVNELEVFIIEMEAATAVEAELTAIATILAEGLLGQQPAQLTSVTPAVVTKAIPETTDVPTGAWAGLVDWNAIMAHSEKPQQRPAERPANDFSIPKSFALITDPVLAPGRYYINAESGRIFDATNRRTTGPSQITGLGMGHVLETVDGGERKFSLTRLKWLARQAKAQETPVPDRNPEVSETAGADFVWLDWMAGYPKRKYRIHKDGRIWNAVDERWEEGEDIIISAGDVSSRTRGSGRSPSTHVKRGALVYRAFFKQTRSVKRLRVKFRDGNRKNCALTNMYYTGSAQ